jgi:glucosyl-dolichyl phosphate glucuronosyltransferase
VPKQPTLSVVICTYNRYSTLKLAIESILSQDTKQYAIELIVVDNSPDQAAANLFGEQYKLEQKLRYILEPAAGLSKARNTGVFKSQSKIVAFIDDDAIAMPGWALAVINAYEKLWPKVGMVGGRVNLRWPTVKPKWIGNKIIGYLGHCDLGDYCREIRKDEWLVGCNISFDREALLAAGGFRIDLGRNGGSNNLLSNEELEVTKKIRASGKTIIFEPAAYVEHVVDSSRVSQRWFRKRAAWQAVSDFMSASADVETLVMSSSSRMSRLSRISSRSECVGFFKEKKTAIGFKQDMDMTYDSVILALAGGGEGAHPVADASNFLRKIFGA